MKKIKHISAVVFVLVQMLVASFLPISAGVRFDTEPCHIYMDGANLNGGNFFIKTYNGLPVYCIEPWVTISWEDVYDVGTLEDYEKLSAQAKEHIAEFSYFGYGYSGHQSGEYYVATQYLIWLELDPEFVRDSHFYTENKGECIDAEMNVYIHDILREVDQYRAPAAFTVTSSSQSEQVGNYYAGKGTMGDVYEIDDRSHVLAQMNLTQNDFGDALQWKDNHLTITLSEKTLGDRTVKFEKNRSLIGTRPMILKDSSNTYQTLGIRGDVQQSATILFHTTAFADIEKVDTNGQYVSDASLQIIDSATKKAVDTWTTTAQKHRFNGLEAGHPYQVVEQDAPIGYYYASTAELEPGKTTNVKLMDQPINASIQKIDDRGNPVQGATLQIQDLDDGRLLQFETSDVPYACGSFLTADHHYRVKELQAPMGHYVCEEQEFTVPHTGGNTISIVMKDPVISYNVLKQDEKRRPVNQASLSLYDTTQKEKQKILSWQSGPDAKEIGQLLEAGHSYTITEEDASTKYFLAADIQFSVPVHQEETEHQIKITDHHIHYQLQKVDENGSPLEDARLVITDITDPFDEGRVVVDWRSTESPLQVNLLERGHVYRLQELSGPDGYYVAEDKVFKVPTYGEDEPITITCEDQRIVYRIHKVDDAKQPVIGSQLQIYEVNEEGEKEIQTITTTADANVVYGLQNDTDYVIKETNVPCGYYQAENFYFHVAKEGTSTPVDIVMEDAPIHASILKTDLEGMPIAGAVMHVVDTQSGQTIGTYVSNEEGPIEIGSALEAGHSYVLKEVEAPKGYYCGGEQKFSVSMRPENTIVVQIKDQPIHCEVQKMDFQEEPLKGAHLCLLEEEKKIVEWISDGTPYDLSMYLQDGHTYSIQETQAPLGYYKIPDRLFTVSSQKDPDLAHLNLMDEAIHYEILKTDEGGNPVEGVQLSLFDVTEEERTLIRQWITTEHAETFGAELTAGHTYRLDETEGVAGYQTASSLTFQVSATGSHKTVIVPLVDETNAISFLKTDEEGKPLADAEMEIFDQAGNAVASFVSNEDKKGVSVDRAGVDLASYLEGGQTYILHETKAPFGYDLCDDITFVMKGTLASKQIVSVQDAVKTLFLKVDKRSAEGSMPLLADCQVTVYHQDTKEIAFTLDGQQASALTDANGAARFQLPYTKAGYYVQETKAPEGFAIDPSPKQLVVESDTCFHTETPKEIHVVDEKNVDTGTQLPYHAFLALLCMLECLLFLKWPHAKA